MESKRAQTVVWLLTGVLALFTAERAAALGTVGGDACPVTQPNDQGYFGKNLRLRHGNEWLATSVSPNGKVIFRPGGPGCVDEHGALWIKWPWWRNVSGQLQVETSRLDGSGEPLSARVPCCYGASGFQSSGVGFPGAGCWQVTARVGEGTLSFVTLVEKIGKGPSPCKPASPNNELQRTRPAQATEPRR
jgi:hypothetical protein